MTDIRFGLHALDGEWHSVLPRYFLAADLLDKNAQVLELGCSTGVGSALLTHLRPSCRITAVDSRPEHVQRAHLQSSSPQLTFREMFYEELDFEDNTFDFVFCLNTDLPLEDKNLVQEIRRVLSPSGICLVVRSVPGSYGLEQVLPSLGDPNHYRPLHTSWGAQGHMSALDGAFSHSMAIAQHPELSVRFRPLPKPSPQLQSSQEELSAPPSDARTRQIPRRSSPPVRFHSLLQEPRDLSPAFHLTLHSDVPLEERVGRLMDQTSIVSLPYNAVSSRIGTILHDLHTSAHHLSQLTTSLSSGIPALSREAMTNVQPNTAQTSAIALAQRLSEQLQNAWGAVAERDKTVQELSRRVHELQNENIALRRSSQSSSSHSDD